MNSLERRSEGTEKFIARIVKMYMEGSPEQFGRIPGQWKRPTTEGKLNFASSQELEWKKFKELVKEYITLAVFATLRERNGEIRLRKLLRQWDNHTDMVHSLSVYFLFRLDSCGLVTTKQIGLALKEVVVMCFRNCLGSEGMEDRLNEAIFATMICEEQEGEKIDLVFFMSLHRMFVAVEIRAKSLFRLAWGAWMLEKIRLKAHNAAIKLKAHNAAIFSSEGRSRSELSSSSDLLSSSSLLREKVKVQPAIERKSTQGVQEEGLGFRVGQ